MPALGQNPSEGRGLTPEEYLKANYEPGDHLAVLLHHRAKGDTIQRVNTAEAIASPKWQAWLSEVFRLEPEGSACGAAGPDRRECFRIAFPRVSILRENGRIGRRSRCGSRG